MIDFFGRKAKAQLAILQLDMKLMSEDLAQKFSSIEDMHKAKRDMLTQLESARSDRSLAVKRCFSAEDLLQEYLKVSIPSGKLRARTREFLVSGAADAPKE